MKDSISFMLPTVPANDGYLDVLAGERTGPQPLCAGAPTQVHGSPEVVADLPGVARLRARGPTGSIEEHRDARAKAERRLRELFEPLGTSDPDELDALCDKAKILDEGIVESESQLATLLSGKTVEELLHEQSLQEAALTRIIEPHPDWEQSPPDLHNLKSRAQDIKRAFISTIESAEAAWEVAHSALTAAAGQEETTARRLDDARKLCTSLQSKYAELTEGGKQPRSALPGCSGM